jgi:hypothetical protein
MHAPVLVEIAAGQDKQEPLPDRSGLPALRAVERGGSKGPELLLRLPFGPSRPARWRGWHPSAGRAWVETIHDRILQRPMLADKSTGPTV